jgi:hypothetical protein
MRVGARADLSSMKLIRAGGRMPGQLRMGVRYGKPPANNNLMKRLKMLK